MSTDRTAQIAAYLDGSLAPATMRDLCAWLNADDAHAEQLVEQMVLESHLRESLLAGEAKERRPRLSDEATTGAAAEVSSFVFRVPRWAYALAAALLIAAAGIAVYLLVLNPQSEIQSPKSPPSPVATVIEARNVGWSSEPLIPGVDIAPQVIRTDRGELELMLRSKTMVNLTGPAELRLIDPMRVAMVRGRASFDCPHTAKGFAVALPDGARVVDLGTRFIVALNAGEMDRVGVTEGSVEVRTGDRVLTLDPRHIAQRVGGVWSIVDAHRIADHSDTVRVLPIPPASVAASDLEDSEHVIVFRERAGVVLDRPQLVGVAEPGTFTYGDTRSGKLDKGTRVDSYLLHFDAVGDDRESAATIDASVTFDRPILGMIPYAGIESSDAAFGAPGVRYESDKTRGIENEDTVTLSEDRRTVTVHLTGYWPDQVRVLIAAEPKAENEPQPSDAPIPGDPR